MIHRADILKTEAQAAAETADAAAKQSAEGLQAIRVLYRSRSGPVLHMFRHRDAKGGRGGGAVLTSVLAQGNRETGFATQLMSSDSKKGVKKGWQQSKLELLEVRSQRPLLVYWLIYIYR
jgi:hypothetical protein